MDFKTRLKELRKSQNLTQEQLAKKVGLSPSTISMYEQGRRNPDLGTLNLLCDYFNVDTDYMLGKSYKTTVIPQNIRNYTVPIYGTIPAGIPLEAIEDVIGYEEINPEMFNGGKEYIGLEIKGDSMYPVLMDGDIAIILKQEDFENGDICAVIVNGDEATMKKVYKNYDDKSVTLKPINMNYSPVTYSREEKPIKILGVLKEIRRKF